MESPAAGRRPLRIANPAASLCCRSLEPSFVSATPSGGSSEEQIPLGEFYRRCEPYFSANGRMIDQEYQVRLPEGMIRCYLVHDKVVGFGHQAINALFPAPYGCTFNGSALARAPLVSSAVHAGIPDA